VAISRSMREAVAARAQHCCEYCRSQEAFSPDRFQVDHIEPRGLGGTDEPGNLAWSCGGCNNAKSDSISASDPESMQPVPLFNPRVHRWEYHFAWIEDFTKIHGRSEIGRATIDRLKLNRPNLLRLRAVLRDAGSHPPTETVGDGIGPGG
jgi:hypothetical protein